MSGSYPTIIWRNIDGRIYLIRYIGGLIVVGGIQTEIERELEKTALIHGQLKAQMKLATCYMCLLKASEDTWPTMLGKSKRANQEEARFQDPLPWLNSGGKTTSPRKRTITVATVISPQLIVTI